MDIYTILLQEWEKWEQILSTGILQRAHMPLVRSSAICWCQHFYVDAVNVSANLICFHIFASLFSIYMRKHSRPLPKKRMSLTKPKLNCHLATSSTQRCYVCVYVCVFFCVCVSVFVCVLKLKVIQNIWVYHQHITIFLLTLVNEFKIVPRAVPVFMYACREIGHISYLGLS